LVLRIGYACLAIGVPHTKMKRCLMKNATVPRLMELTWHNLNALENLVNYNIRTGIQLFRISSNLIPFGSSPVNQLPWWDMYSSWLQTIGHKIKASNMRVSMHPGQYTVINSYNDDIVQRSIDDLNYHARVLDCLGLGPEHKLILHIGGVYDNKQAAMDRFIANYGRLPKGVRDRLVIENDDKSYTTGDVLAISEKIHIPVVYDTLHNLVNPGQVGKNDAEWIASCQRTWHIWDGPQKIHYSQQAPGKPPGAHCDSIAVGEFVHFINTIEHQDLDIMIEVKDKNLSAVKCMAAINMLNS
jgi:UV DNA damage endonuclease